jgi:surfeit locus 1 family protein
VLLDNKIRQHRPGYEVVTPLRVESTNAGEHVLVNRGWMERSAELRTPAGEIRIEGIALARLPQALRIGEESRTRVRQNLDVAAYAAETGLKLRSTVIEQHSDSGDGLLREWPRPDAGAEKNEAYAFQWYSLATLAIVLLLALSFRKRQDEPAQ